MLNSLNPNKTRAILIGTTEFVDFNKIDAVENNLTEFAKVLADENIFGLLPENNILIIKNQTNEDVELKLIEYTENARKENIETLIVYFAGHGFRNREGKYFLATKNSRKKLIRTSGNSAIAYDTVKGIIKSSKIPQTIIFIDACYSGTVAQGNDKQIFKEYRAEGTYTITSSDSTELSYFDSDEKHTIFTGELLNILKNGLQSIEKEKVSLTDLYKELRTSIKKKEPKMSPQQLASKEIIGEDFLFFKNTNYDKKALVQKQINEQITEADNLFNKLELDKAEIIYIRLKEKIIAKNIDFNANTLKELNDKIKNCRDRSEQKRTFEEHYHIKPKRVKEAGINTKSNLFSIAIITILIITIVLLIWKPWNNNIENYTINNDTITKTEIITKIDTVNTEINKTEYPITENGVTWTDKKNGTFIDERDNHKYKVIKIGEQVWMAENLNYTQDIPHITADNEWKNLKGKDAAWCYYIHYTPSPNDNTYGALYTHAAALNVAPKGWHLPSKQEFETLLYNYDEKILCNSKSEKITSLKALIDKSNIETKSYNILLKGGTSGFNAHLSGWRYSEGDFGCGIAGLGLWSSTEYSNAYAWDCQFFSEQVRIGTPLKNTGLSVRLLRN